MQMNKYKNTYPLMPLDEVLNMEQLAKQLKVSEVARGPDGWLTHHKQNKEMALADMQWLRKRHGFISRVLPEYEKKPSLRRYLSLIMWSYQPKKPPF